MFGICTLFLFYFLFFFPFYLILATGQKASGSLVGFAVFIYYCAFAESQLACIVSLLLLEVYPPSLSWSVTAITSSLFTNSPFLLGGSILIHLLRSVPDKWEYYSAIHTMPDLLCRTYYAGLTVVKL